MDNKNLKSLYDGLIKKGYSKDEIGDEATFNAKMADKNNRRQLFNYVSKRGDFRIGDYDSYEKRLAGTEPVKEEPSQTGTQPAEQLPVQDDETAVAQPQRKTLEQQAGMGIAMPDASEMAAKFAAQPVLYNPKANIDKALASGKLDTIINEDEERNIDAVFTPAQVKKAEDIYANYADRFALTSRGKELSAELADIQRRVQEKYANEFLASDDFRKLKEQYKGKELDDAANKAFSELYGKRIEEELSPYADAYRKEAYNRYEGKIAADVKAYQEEQRKQMKDKVASDVSSLQQSVTEQQDKLTRSMQQKAGSGGNAMSALMGSRAYITGTESERKSMSELSAAQNLIEESQNIIDEAKRKGNTNFVAGLGRGFAQEAFNPDTWSFGLVEMRDSKLLIDALDRFDRGEELTDSQKALMDAAVANMATNAYFYSDLGRGYKAGTVSGQSVPFMLEFAINPVSASGSTIAKNILKYGMKKFGKQAVKNNAAKFAARLTGDAAAAAAMTGTTGAARVAGGTLERMGGDIKLDETGTEYAGRTGQQGVGEALGKSFASTFLENQSEMVFNAFKGIGPMIWSKADKLVPGGAAGIIDNAIMGKAGAIWRKIKSDPVMTELAKRTQFHGLGEEYLEEVYNNFANIPLGEMTLEEATDLDNNIDTFLGLAPTSIAFAMLGAGGLAAEKIRHRRRMQAALGNMERADRERLAELERMAGEAGNEDIKEFIRATIEDKDLTPEQKKEEIAYAYNLAVGNAIDEAEAERDTESVEAKERMIQEGRDIYTAHDPAEMRRTVVRREMAEESLQKTGLQPEEIESLRNAKPQERASLIESLPQNTWDAARTYLDALDREEGLNAALDDAHAAEWEESTRRVEGFTLPNNTVTLVSLGHYATDTAQYGIVVSGIGADGSPTQSKGRMMVYPVPMLSDGTFDFSAADENNPIAMVPDAYADYKVFTPDDVLEAMNPATTADEMLLEPVSNAPGNSFGIMLDDGTVQNVVVSANDGSGRIAVVLPDGKATYMDEADLNRRKSQAERLPLMQEQSLRQQEQAEAVRQAVTADVDAEVAALQPQPDETIVTSDGRKAVISEVTGDGIDVIYTNDNGEMVGIGQLPLEEYYQYKQKEYENAKAQTNAAQPSQGNAADTTGTEQAEMGAQPSAAAGTSAPAASNNPQIDYPKDESGEPIFSQMQPQQTVSVLQSMLQDDAPAFAAAKLQEAQKAAEKAAKKSPKATSLVQRVTENEQIRKEREEASRNLAYWQEIAGMFPSGRKEEAPKKEPQQQPSVMEAAQAEYSKNQERISAMSPEEIAARQEAVQRKIDSGAYSRPSAPRKRTRYDEENRMMGEAYTPMEHVLREIATGNAVFLWGNKGNTKGLGAHLGLSDSEAERKKHIWAISSEGLPPEMVAEEIHADMPSWMQDRVTDMDVFGMILDAFQTYGTPSRMWEEAKRLHGVDNVEQEDEADIERRALQWEAEANRMTVDEWVTYNDIVEEELTYMLRTLSDEDINGIFEQFINEQEDEQRRNQAESAESTQQPGDTENGNAVLPEEQPDNAEADRTEQEQPAAATETDEQGGSVLPEQTGSSGFTVEKRFHKKDNKNIYAVNFTERMERDAFLDAKRMAKNKGGYYSSFGKGGFIFETEEAANNFGELIMAGIIGRNVGRAVEKLYSSNFDKEAQEIRKKAGITVYNGARNTAFSSDSKMEGSLNLNDLGGIAETVDSHGLAKGNELEHLLYLLVLGVDPNRTFDTAPLATSEGQAVGAGLGTGSGHSYRTGLFIIASEPGGRLYDNGKTNIKTVLINDMSFEGGNPKGYEHAQNLKKVLSEQFPQIDFILYSEANDYYNNGSQKSAIEAARAEVDTNPTEAQKEAGNYKKGHVIVDGYNITLENPKGSERTGTDKNGNTWSVTMNNDYGYIRGTEGVDGDHIDVFLSDNPESGKVFVVDQLNEDDTFDEHKVMYGFDTRADAIEAYLANYSPGWTGLGDVTEVTKDQFKKWIDSSHRKTKPFAEYKSMITPKKPETVNGYKKGDKVMYQGKSATIYDFEYDGRPVLDTGLAPVIYTVAEWEDVTVKKSEEPKKVSVESIIENLNKRGQTKLSENVVLSTASETAQPSEPAYGSQNKVVSTARYEEVKKRMRSKLNNLNAGYDPEIIAIGAEMAAYHIEAGARTFVDFAKRMITDMGDEIRPYLKSIYSSARHFPGMEEYKKTMTPEIEYDEIDINSIKLEEDEQTEANTEAIVSEAETIANEAESRIEEAESPEQIDAISEEIDEQIDAVNKQLSELDYIDSLHSGMRVILKDGRNVLLSVVMHQGEQVSATQFSKPHVSRLYASYKGNLIDFVPEDIDLDATVKYNSAKPASELSGNSSEYQDKASQERKAVSQIGSIIRERALSHVDGVSVQPLSMKDVKNILDGYSMLSDMSATDMQELVELAMTNETRNVALKYVNGDRAKFGFDLIVAMYNMQPLLNARDSTRFERQQYSTPTPFGYVMGQFVQSGKQVSSVLEPSAGNGALTITFPSSIVHVNDIDERRLANLRTLGYAEVTNQDALQPFSDSVDVVMTNPPFGTTTTRELDNGQIKINSLEGLMAINALESMKDDGRAAIVIGGNTSYRDNGAMQSKDLRLFSYLYTHYNVVDVINLDGEMYKRNGTKYNVRIILINGRKPDATKIIAPPVKSKARAEQVKSFEELYNRIQDDIRGIQQVGPVSSGTEGKLTSSDTAGGRENRNVGNTGNSGQRGRSVGSNQKLGTENNVGGRETASSAGDGRKGTTDVDGLDNVDRPDAGSTENVSGPQQVTERSGSTEGTDGRAAGPDAADRGDNAGRSRLAVNLGDEKVPYPNRSQSGTLMSVVPANQAQVLADSLADIGDVDQFLVDQLGYSSKEELFSYLAAEQIDSVSLAINQMSKGNGFIIGDMTGVGKGRQGAALIRYAVRKGFKPIYFTQKPALFSDNYRDLADIGSGELRPFIIGSDPKNATITDAAGNVVHRLPSDKERKRVYDYILEYGTLPDEYDYVITTYSQINNGTKEYEATKEGITAKDKSYKKKSPSPADKSGQERRNVLEALSKDNIMILDESHTAGGSGGGSMFMQYIMPRVKGVTFLSATFAKRADNMPIYAMKTDLAKSGITQQELIDAIAQGGVTLQEIMSKQLVQSGQMIRRERSFNGVTIDWLSVSDEEDATQRKQFDEVSSIFSDIRAFQKDFINPLVANRSEELAEEGGYSDLQKGTADLGASNTPFASKMYNLVNQLLFSLKADAVANRVIENLKNGFKPVISFTNTMEGFLDEAPKDTPMDIVPNFSLTLLRALDGVMRYTETDIKGEKINLFYTPEQLGEEGKKKYYEIKDKIEHLSANLPISPMDAIKTKIEEAGYKVGEITGRNLEMVRNEDGKYVVRNRKDKDKKSAARDFNNGQIDVLMVNKSGSTGISLHASPKFQDQRQRVMVFAQFQSDINDEVQMRGRIDRTGQIYRGKYEYIMSSIPAEQRLQMMFKAKLKSLDANTTSSQKSKLNEMQVTDFLNKYGDEVTYQYMIEHPELSEKLGDPLNLLADNGAEIQMDETNREKMKDSAAKIARYLPFLPVKEQEEVFKEITDAYAVKMQLLNDAGENDLEITTMPLKARTLSRKIWKPGAEPNSGNAFADNTYIEEVEVDVLKKPMKADEVKKNVARLSEGQPFNGWRKSKIEEINQIYSAKIESLKEKLKKSMEEKIAKAKDAYIRKSKEARSKGKNEFTDEEIERMSNVLVDEIKAKANEGFNKQKNAIEARRDNVIKIFEAFEPLNPLIIPTNLEEGTATIDITRGTLLGFKFSKDYSPSSSTAVFATLDGRRKVEIPLKNTKAFSAIRMNSMMQPTYLKSLNIDSWDSFVPKQTRKKAYIVTGNLLQALVDVKKSEKARGYLVSYSTEEGETRQGLLMSDSFQPSDLTTSVPISSRLEQIRRGETVTSEDKRVIIEKNAAWRDGFSIKVPKSKKQGGEFFEDKTLRSLVNDKEFTSKGNFMVAEFNETDLPKVLNRLSSLGVKVADKAKLTDTDKSDVRFRDETPAEEQRIIEEAKKNGTYMKAPNGQPTNLTERQWIQVRTKAFKDWFGDWENSPETASKVVDENGEPKVVYHGTYEEFNAFEEGVATNAFEEMPSNGYMFTDEEMAASVYGEVKEVFLDIKSPNDYRDTGKLLDVVSENYQDFNNSTDEFYFETADDARIEYSKVIGPDGRLYSQDGGMPESETMWHILQNKLKDVSETNGYDGFIINDSSRGEEHVSYCAFYPNKIKSATDNIGTFEKSNPDIRYRNTQQNYMNEVTVDDVMVEAEKLGVPVTVFTSVEELPEGYAKRAIMLGRYIKGWYDIKTQRIHLFLPYATDIEDVRATLLHEGVGHLGLRRMVGEDNFNQFLNDVFDGASKKIRDEIVSLARKHGFNIRIATEEYLAEMAEKGIKEPTFWDKVKQLFRKLLEKIGYKWQITDNDLSYLLWENYYQLRQSQNPLHVAKETGMRAKLGIGEFAKREDNETRFREYDFYNRPEIIKKYDAAIDSSSFRFQEAFQDSMLSLKVLQDTIIKETGKEIRTFENAYTAENRLSSLNKQDNERYMANFFAPLMDHVEKLSSKYGRERVEDYIYAKSGLERNEVILQRDANKEMQESIQELDKKLEKGEITQPQYKALINTVIKRYNETIAAGGDFSGLTGLVQSKHQEELEQLLEENKIDKAEFSRRMKQIGDTYKDFAENMVSKFEKDVPSAEVDQLWNLINAATHETLNKGLQSGMISREQYDNLKGMMKYYVPLKGWKEQIAENVYDYTRKEIPVQREKGAKGRKSLADNPIANIALSAQNAIILGNRNKMKQRFFNFVINRPNELAVIRDVWYARTAHTVHGQVEAVYPEIDETDDFEAIQQKLQDFEQRMKEMEANGEAFRGKVPFGLSLKIKKGQMPEHMVSVMINGQEYTIYINGNPRAAQALNGRTNSEGDENIFWDMYNKVKRFYGGGLTSNNPDFVLANLVRDAIHSTTMVYMDKGFKESAKFLRNIPMSFWHVQRGVRGKFNSNRKKDVYFKEFVENGGETGYTAIHTLEDYKAEYDKMLTELKGFKKLAGTGKMAFEQIAKWLETANRIAEDVNRFNAYVSCREAGLSIEESIDAAKNITVNFNKKGALNKSKGGWAALAWFLNKWILFFNPSVQGIYQLGQTYAKNKGRVKRTLATILASGFLMPWLNNLFVSMWGDDDDDYFNQTDYTRMNNWLFWTGKGYIKIPLPPFFREVYGLGDILYRVVTGRLTADKAAVATLRQIQSAIGFINLIPNGEPRVLEAVGGLMPDLIAPLMDVAFNRDFMGRELAKDSEYTKNIPEYERIYKGVSPVYVEFSRMLNQIGGDDAIRNPFWGDFINPAYMEHIVTGYTGGVGRTISNLVGMIADAGTGNLDNIEMRSVPVANRFYNPINERTVSSAVNRVFYDYQDEFERLRIAQKRYKEFVKDGRKEFTKELEQMKKNGEADFIRYFSARMKTLRKKQDLLKVNPNNKKLEKEIQELKSEMIMESKNILSGK